MYRRQFLQSGLAGWTALKFPVNPGPAAEGNTLVRLNSNENPWGLSDQVRASVVKGLDEAGRYPLSSQGPLVEDIASVHGVSVDHVVLGNGSSEVIQMVVQAIAGSGGLVIAADPTFESIFDYASPLDCKAEKIPLTREYAHDLKAMREASRTSAAALVYVCNPNNPSGTVTPCRDLEEWIRNSSRNTFFLIDEAYFDYVQSAEYWSLAEWVKRRRNVMVTRTFSKVYGLAGLRIGYGLAHPDTAARVRKFASDININHVAIVAARTALDDQAFVQKSLASNDIGRRMLERCLEELGVGYIPSYTNFLMHRVSGSLTRHIERMQSFSIRVGRPFPAMLDFNRVSIGTPDEMQTFTATLRTFREKGWI